MDPSQEAFSAKKKELKELFIENRQKTFQELKDILLDSSSYYNTLILLESQQREAESDRLKNNLDDEGDEELQVEFNKIGHSLLTLIDNLQLEDLIALPDEAVTVEVATQHAPVAANEPEEEDDRKEGCVLYNIPTEMPKDKNTRCEVRIAWDKVFFQKILKDNQEAKIEATQVTELMQVKLVDDSGEEAFEINPINDEAEQIIYDDVDTSWFFNVKPLKEGGPYTLTLKVAVIEPINGKERKRQIVLFETVNVYSTEEEAASAQAGIAEKESKLKPALMMSFFPVAGAMNPLKKAPEPQPESNSSGKNWARIFTFIAVIATVAAGLLYIGSRNTAGESTPIVPPPQDTVIETFIPIDTPIIESPIQEEEPNNPATDNDAPQTIDPLPPPPVPNPPTPAPSPAPPVQPNIEDYTYVTDKDNQKYKVLKLKDGKQWMLQNLNYDNGVGNWCYRNRNKYCTKFGRLYTWEAAKQACDLLEGGWRLPTKGDWHKLKTTYSGTSDQADFQALMIDGNSKFDALFGGYSYGNGASFSSENVEGFYWTSDSFDGLNAYGVHFNAINNQNKLLEDEYLKSRGHSCRCIKD
ncbi:MAG: hypothetical protein DHS20C18_19750 [Saprospiraceae bacterium]|nr:MAG: hypothetical protein DHS20C18_19750 [Saprospiraceae bacterium]